MKTIHWLATSTLFIILLGTACKKDEAVNDQVQQQIIVSSEDQATAEDLYEDVEDQVDEAIETRGGSGDCPVVTADPDWQTYPRTVTIDYGDVGCEGPGGRIRKGMIVVNVSDNIVNAGAVRTATFVDFSIDDAQIMGTRTLTNLGYDNNGNITLSRTVDGGKIIFPNGDESSWESDYTLTQIDGGDTPFNFIDNVFELTGSANGVNRNGKAFTTEIIDPLVRQKACPWVVSGSLSLTVDNVTVTLDYGDGACDRKAILTLPNGVQKEILIHRWW